jgi:hypothetical protein
LKKDHFYKLLKNPRDTSSVDIKELEKILSNHPYFTSARIIHAKAQLERKNIGLEDEIEKNGNHFPNLLVLEDWVNELAPKVQEEVNSPVEIDELKDVALEILEWLPTTAGDLDPLAESPKIEEPEEKIENEVSTQIEKPESEIEQNLSDSSKIEEQEISTSEEEQESNEEEKVENKPISEPEIITQGEPGLSESGEVGGIAEEVMKTLIELRKLREKRVDKTETKETEKITKKNKPVSPAKKSKQVSRSKSKKSSPAKTNEAKISSRKTDLKTKKIVSSNKPPSKKKVDEKSKTTKSAQEEREQKLESQRSLIREFVANPPEIEKGYKGGDGPNIDLAIPSTSENQLLVSESLAKIFSRQGKMEKAKGVYEQLMLKFPKKKSYFAAQIETLKK